MNYYVKKGSDVSKAAQWMGGDFVTFAQGLGLVFKVEEGNIIQVRGLNGTFQPLQEGDWVAVLNGDAQVHKDEAFQSNFLKVDYTQPTRPNTPPSDGEVPATVSSDGE